MNFNQIVNAMKVFRKKVFEKLKGGHMSPFQVLVGSLCFRFYKPHVPPNILGLFGMLEALEEGLNGDCDGKTVEEVLESVKNYKNTFYLSPTIFHGEIKTTMLVCQFTFQEFKTSEPFKISLVKYIQSELANTLRKSGITLDLKNPDCFEGVLAVSLEFGLLYHLSDPKAAIKLACDPRPAKPY